MPLEIVTSGHPNIKTLVLESPRPREKPVVFDPTSVVRTQDLSFIKESLDKLRNQEDPSNQRYLAHYLSAIKYIDPEFFATLETTKKLSSFNMTEALIATEKQDNIGWTRYAAELALLYPDHPSKTFVREEVGKYVPKVAGKLQTLFKYDRWIIEAYRMARDYAVTLHSYGHKSLGLDDEFYGFLLGKFENSKKTDYGMDRPESIADEASAIRILYLEKPVTDYLTSKDWEFMEAGFMKRINDKKWYGQKSFIPYAFHLKILAAEKVEFIPDQGMKLVMSEPKFEPLQATPVPGMRKF